MSNCTSCSKELVPNAKFCKFCGTTQVASAQPVAKIPILTKVYAIPACKKCGNALVPNAKFCKHCGTSVAAPHVATLPITETPKIAAVNTTVSSKIESELVSNKVGSPSFNSVATNEKTGITGLQITMIVAVIILLGIFVFVAKSNNSAPPTVTTPAPDVVVAPPPVAAPVVTPQAEVEAQQAALKQAESESQQAEDELKRMADDEAKRLAEEEKAAAVADAEEQKRLAHEEKMTLLQQQKDEKIKRADELKKAREELALAKLQANTEQAKLNAERARIEREAKENAQSVAQYNIRNKLPTTLKQTSDEESQAVQGKYKAKFRGFLGVKVATRYYATDDMKNQALQLWKDEGKILEPDGSITILTKENQAAEALGQ